MKYVLIILLIVITLAGCNTNANNQSDSCGVAEVCDVNIETITKATKEPPKITVDKIEVYHFHGANQCYSCKTIKTFAEKTVNTYYPDLLESGKMEFRSINGELPENIEVTIKYGATGSSLWIGTYINGEFHKEENINVWYKVNDEEDFLIYLKEFLDKRLSGDLS